MTLPPRLLAAGSDAYELSALRAAATDRGSSQAFERVLSAIGPIVAAPLPSPPLSPPAHLPAALAKPSIVALKSLLVGLTVGTAGLAVSSHLTNFGAPAVRERSASVELARRVQQTPRASVEQATPSAHAEVAPPPSAMPGAVASPVRPISARDATKTLVNPGPPRAASDRVMAVQGVPTLPPAESELSREVALLDEARKQLSLGNWSTALATLDRREHEISVRVLEPEALMVRVEALLKSGQRARARALVESVVLRAPNSSSAERLQLLLDQNNP